MQKLSEEIRTARLLLRRARPDDAPALHRLFCDPEVMRYTSRLPHTELAQTESFLARMLTPGDSDDFIILYEGEVVGKCGLWRENEIGFQIVRERWGMGLAREAAQAVVERARSRGLKSIKADVDPRNERSLKLMASLGFVQTGEARNTFQLGDEWVDSLYFQLDLSECDTGEANPASS